MTMPKEECLARIEKARTLMRKHGIARTGNDWT